MTTTAHIIRSTFINQQGKAENENNHKVINLLKGNAVSLQNKLTKQINSCFITKAYIQQRNRWNFYKRNKETDLRLPI